MSRRRPCGGWAYYNEHDPFAAAWLRELIKAGHIAPGIVDERSIEDVVPTDLVGFTQCHFFAGIGVWSYALRCAGWPDSRPVWTGSCPCQPFSAAGKGKGFADERHLWPAFFHLICQRRPAIVFGEQVASRDGLAWLDLVQADMEAAGYACGAVDTCAAGFGAPHIRQRLYWVAAAPGGQKWWKWKAGQTARPERQAGRCGSPCELGNAISTGLEGYAGHSDGESGRQKSAGSTSPAGCPCGMEHPSSIGRERRETATPRYDDDGQASQRAQGEHGACGAVPYRIPGHRPGPINGQWRNADWLFCRDGKWRSVEPGTFPLAHGAANRLGRLRGYGNALCAPQAQAFIEAVLFYEVKK